MHRMREKARALRAQRKLTIDELAERLALSRSTIYYWVRDLPIERKGRANADQRRGSRAMRRKYRLMREEAYREGLESFDALVRDPSFRDFVCLYIAEGTSAIATASRSPTRTSQYSSSLQRGSSGSRANP